MPHPVIDADGHVSERIDWAQALPPDLREKAPKRLPPDVGGTVGIPDRDTLPLRG